MNTPCSIEILAAALAGNLPADDEASLHRHLEECEQCGAALERMAGGPAWCQEAAALLSGDELDAALPTGDEWSDVDFTVEHLEPTDEPNMLGRLGGYDVLEIIGRGGMGVVLKGFDRELKRCVAIKVLAPHLALSPLARKRFAREAQAAAAVVHPHVLAIHQVQPNGRLPFLVMPLVAGESLAERLTAQGRLELKEVLRIGMQAAAGLAAAHEQGLVHRDVKPANILLEKGVERAVLTDFGLARTADDVTLTRWGIIAGTPQYMSPEQVRGEPLDGRSDLFSLGCVLYETATGVSPFRSESVMATMRRLVDDAPQAIASLNPELPPWFAAIVDRLLEKDSSRRFNSAKEVSELLEGCLAHVQQPNNVPLPAALPEPARKAAPPVPSTRFKSITRIKGVLAMIAAFGIALLGMFLLSGPTTDIAGQWSGEEWGQVVLKKANDTEYTGNYSATDTKHPGEIHVRWSRIEQQFTGTWREGDDRFGDISVCPVGNELHVAFGADAKCKVNPGTPHLKAMTWTRANVTATAAKPDGRTLIKSFSTSDSLIAKDGITIEKNAWRIEAKGDRTVQLFEVSAPGVEDCRVIYRAKLKTENVEGRAYLEMFCRFPSGEYFSKGLESAVTGTTDWASYETPFFLKKGERPDLIKLNLVIEGKGTLWMQDVELSKAPLEPEAGTVSESDSPVLKGVAWLVKRNVSAAVEKAVKTISTCAEGDPRVTVAIGSLKGLKEADVVVDVVKFLDSKEATSRRAAVYILWQGKFASIEPAIPGLLRLCEHQEDLTRGMAALALGGDHVASSLPALMKMTSDDQSGYARRCAAYALGLLGDRAATGALEKALKDPEALVRMNAQAALAMLRNGAAENKKLTDAHRAVLKEELRQAQAVAARAEAGYKAGVITGLEYQAAKGKVEVLEAELTGDPVKVARARLAVARRQLDMASSLFKAGVMTDSEYEKLKGDVAIAETKLREAEAIAAPSKPESEKSGKFASISRTFPLRFKLASSMADDLGQILLGRPGQEAKPSANNQEITVTAPPDVMIRVRTFITVMDWPDSITRRSNYEYPRESVLRAARSFFYACAIEDAEEAFSNLLSLHALAELKGDTKSEHFFNYNMGGVPDSEWEKSLRADWPGKKEAIQRMVREWNRYPLIRITEDSGVAIGFGEKHFCSVSFAGAPKDFYTITIEPDRKEHGSGKGSFYFSSLPPWWNVREKKIDNPSTPPSVSAALLKTTTDQVIVEDLALEMLVAIRDKDNVALEKLASDRIKQWPEALPHFAMEMRERFHQMTGKSFDMKAVQSLVEGDRAVVKCTGDTPKGVYLVLFFVKTGDGWRNWLVRNSPPSRALSEFLKEKPPAASAK